MSDDLRKEFHEFLGDKIAEHTDENPTVLVGWVLVYEGAHEDGKRSLNVLTSEITGEQDTTPWAMQGYLKYAMDAELIMFEPFEEGDDDEPD